MFRVAVLVFSLSVPAAAQVSTTERVNFAAGGMIRLTGSFGNLNVEGWDRPEVEITVIKSTPHYYKTQQQQATMRRLGLIRVVTERRSAMELEISTFLHPRRSRFAPPMPLTTTAGVMVEYRIRVPRESRLVIHHGSGYVLVNNVSGDIEATSRRGDILLMLPDSGAYSIDAKSKMGTVSSEFEGTTHVRHFVGEGFARASQPPSHRIYLRMGFGGITIKKALAESF